MNKPNSKKFRKRRARRMRLCDCGQPATVRHGGAWICQGCRDVEITWGRL